jgi:PST family polysaccharide transporter
VVFVVQLISTIVLARLLAPADFGVVTMVTTFSLLLLNFGQNGFTEAVIQREQLNHFLASNLFWINVGVSFVLSCLFAGGGSLLARFYNDPRVTHVAFGISLTILLNGLTVIHLALLKRAQLFSLTSANDVFSMAISVALTISLALLGWGYWALVAGVIVRPLFQLLGAWYFCRWVPAFPRRERGTGSVVRFALNVYGRFTVNYGARNADNLLVGWQFGSAALGYYKRAYDLFVLPANQLLVPIQEVALSALSRLERESDQYNQYKRYFLNGLSLLAFVGMGTGAILTLVGKNIIHLLLGPKWGPAGHIFVLFGPGIGIMIIYNSIGLIHLSLGNAHRWFRWVVIEFIVTAVLFLAGLPWGPEGIAAAWTTSFWVLTLPAFHYAGSPIKFSVKQAIGAVWRYSLASLVAGLLCYWLLLHSSSLSASGGALGDLIYIVVASSIFIAIYLFLITVLHGGIDPLRRMGRILLDVLPWKSASRSAASS